MSESVTRQYQTIKLRWDEEICYLQIYRPQANNTVDATLIAEFEEVLEECQHRAKILILEGLPEVFCFGADFSCIDEYREGGASAQIPEALYDVWLNLVQGPFISIAHVRGGTNAGGIGFVAACDIVICESSSTFSLSELLFGLIPACVLPFLARRINLPRANYMTLLTQPVSAQEALAWGLVDAHSEDTARLLKKHVQRLRLIPKSAIARYKVFTHSLSSFLEDSRATSVETNLKVFGDRENIQKIDRYLTTGLFPWESEQIG